VRPEPTGDATRMLTERGGNKNVTTAGTPGWSPGRMSPGRFREKERRDAGIREASAKRRDAVSGSSGMDL